tara:strand:- start:30 stop:290 length:261 start_codon:yes stop_codon:yes gene_type:complete
MDSNKDILDRAVGRPCNDGFYDISRNIRHYGPIDTWSILMENPNQKRNIDPQKVNAEKLNGRFALIGLIALIGAYISTGQIVPGVI